LLIGDLAFVPCGNEDTQIAKPEDSRRGGPGYDAFFLWNGSWRGTKTGTSAGIFALLPEFPELNSISPESAFPKPTFCVGFTKYL